MFNHVRKRHGRLELEDETEKVLKWELPGLIPRAPVSEFSSLELVLTRESLGLDSRGSSGSLRRLVILIFISLIFIQICLAPGDVLTGK